MCSLTCKTLDPLQPAGCVDLTCSLYVSVDTTASQPLTSLWSRGYQTTQPKTSSSSPPHLPSLTRVHLLYPTRCWATLPSALPTPSWPYPRPPPRRCATASPTSSSLTNPTLPPCSRQPAMRKRHLPYRPNRITWQSCWMKTGVKGRGHCALSIFKPGHRYSPGEPHCRAWTISA